MNEELGFLHVLRYLLAVGTACTTWSLQLAWRQVNLELRPCRIVLLQQHIDLRDLFLLLPQHFLQPVCTRLSIISAPECIVLVVIKSHFLILQLFVELLEFLLFDLLFEVLLELFLGGVHGRVALPRPHSLVKSAHPDFL